MGGKTLNKDCDHFLIVVLSSPNKAREGSECRRGKAKGYLKEAKDKTKDVLTNG